MPKLMNIRIQFQPLRKVLDKLMDKIQTEFDNFKYLKENPNQIKEESEDEKKAEDEIKLNEENKST